MAKKVRVRFAPSPTGPLHIGGVRTALYNYLFARHHGGVFILRIEDTDQKRLVPGAEEYIIESLYWLGLQYDEGPDMGGDYGPYRQSERRQLYLEYAQQLIDRGHAYYAFDTPEELEQIRTALKERGVQSPKYDASVRRQMRNSLTLPSSEVEAMIEAGVPYVVRLKVMPGEEIAFDDVVRGRVVFQSDSLDDKVLVKADGMPTYHLANVVDDHLMGITHVIRGEEWLSSTPHHVLLYRSFGWADAMPRFVHLPLILKPSGKGKLSKRDGVVGGFPVFPIAWREGESYYEGYREVGFLPEGLNNFLAFLGWNPGDEREIFTIEELAEAFSLERVQVSGARFDYHKALWFNQQHIARSPIERLVKLVKPFVEDRHGPVEEEWLARVVDLMRERMQTLRDLAVQASYFFVEDYPIDEIELRKRWSAEARDWIEQVIRIVERVESFEAEKLAAEVKSWMREAGIKAGRILPLLRLAWTGTLKGPDLWATAELLGKERCLKRLHRFLRFTVERQTASKD